MFELSSLSPRFNEDNKKLIQLMLRNPLYMKENNVGLNFGQKLILSTFLNNAPIVHLSIAYPIFYISLGVYGILTKKHRTWFRYTFFKAFLYPFYSYSLYFLTTRFLITDKVINYTLSAQKQLAKQQNALDNQLLIDKVQQLNLLLAKGDFQQLEKSETRIKNLVGYSGVKKNVFEKLSKIDAEHHTQVRKLSKFQRDEDDPSRVKLQRQVNDFIDKLYQ